MTATYSGDEEDIEGDSRLELLVEFVVDGAVMVLMEYFL